MPTLGCGEYVAALATRGGGVVFANLEASDVEWGRVGNDTSGAKATLGGDERCRAALRQAAPWSHELILYRDQRPVWVGPITNRDGRTLEARDLSVWLDRRWFRRDLGYVNANLAAVLVDVVDEALRPDRTPRISVLVVARPDVTGTREYRAGQHTFTGDAARELGTSGAEWALVGRTMLVTRRRTRDSGDVPELRDDHLAGDPTVKVNGLLMSNSWGVRGLQPQLTGSADDAVFGLAQNADSVDRYGLLDRIATEDTIRDAASAAAAARARLVATAAPIMQLGSLTLTPTAPVSIDHLLPGALLRIALDDLAQPFRQLVRITSVTASASGGGAEQVDVDVEPVAAVPA